MTNSVKTLSIEVGNLKSIVDGLPQDTYLPRVRLHNLCYKVSENLQKLEEEFSKDRYDEMLVQDLKKEVISEAIKVEKVLAAIDDKIKQRSYKRQEISSLREQYKRAVKEQNLIKEGDKNKLDTFTVMTLVATLGYIEQICTHTVDDLVFSVTEDEEEILHAAKKLISDYEATTSIT